MYTGLPLPPTILDVARKEACLKCGQTQNTDGNCPHPDSHKIAPLAEIIASNLGLRPDQRVKEIYCDDLRSLMLLPMELLPVVIVRVKSEGPSHINQGDIDRFVYDRQYCMFGGSFARNNGEEVRHALWPAVLLFDGLREKAGDAALLSKLRIVRPELMQRKSSSLKTPRSASGSVAQRLGRAVKRYLKRAESSL